MIGCALDRSDTDMLPLDIVHNPLATYSLPVGLLSGAAEWVAVPAADHGEEYVLHKRLIDEEYTPAR